MVRFETVAMLLLLLISTSRIVSASSHEPQPHDAVRAEVGPVPTPQHIVDLMLRLANVSKDDTIYDLGCGDGRIVVTAAKDYGCAAIGFDVDPECVAESRANVQKTGLGELVTIEQRDIFELDLSQADVVTLYLLPSLNERLIPQLNKMRPGSRIVSHEFPIPGVEPDIEIQCYSRVHGVRSKIYLWTTPFRVSEEALNENTVRETGPLLPNVMLPTFVTILVVAIVVLGLYQKSTGRRLVLRVEKRDSD